MDSPIDRDSNARRYGVAITVLVALGLFAIVAATMRADRNRAHARAMRNSVAMLAFSELLERQQDCELELGPKSARPNLDPVYCREVTRTIAAQALQLEDNPAPAHVHIVPSQWEHDRRAIGGPRRSTPLEPASPLP